MIAMRSNRSKPKLVGYAAKFYSPALIAGQFYESIMPGAFSKSLRSGPDVRALANHNWDQVLALKQATTFCLTRRQTTQVIIIKRHQKRIELVARFT
jgi:phage head maturation protease